MRKNKLHAAGLDSGNAFSQLRYLFHLSPVILEKVIIWICNQFPKSVQPIRCSVVGAMIISEANMGIKAV